jgi:hypothetical protein
MSFLSYATPVLYPQYYADDVDVVNPIGPAIGHHKLTFLYNVLLNRNATDRMHIAHINLACVVLSKDLAKFTPAVVVSGAHGESDQSHSTGACLRRFDAGVEMQAFVCVSSVVCWYVGNLLAIVVCLQSIEIDAGP